MTQPEHAQIIGADRAHTWHPFTPMADWCAPGHEPLVLVSGRGALLRDSLGHEYVDGNSSIWTNLHGHAHPRLNAAVQRQLGQVAHTSFRLHQSARRPARAGAGSALAAWHPDARLLLGRRLHRGRGRLKIAAQFWQNQGEPERRKFVAFAGAYHGDTLGASSLGGIARFHERFAAWQMPVLHASGLHDLDGLAPQEIAAVIIEPLMQGANQMRLWSAGLLRELRAWCDRHGALLIADEVMTGFGRTGTMFACEQESVVPDLLALAKGLTGGYLPLAATLVTERLFAAFLGGPERTLHYGHSYTGNQLACAVALESLAIFREERVLERIASLSAQLTALLLEELRSDPRVYEIRQCGLIAGIELRQPDGEPFPLTESIGARVCLAARTYGLLTRPILDTLVLMPPYCITDAQLAHAVRALRAALNGV